MKHKLNFVRLPNLPILDQLLLEETLLQYTNDNWFFTNTGSPPAIVLGSTCNPNELISPHFLKNPTWPVIKRFSAGGCVLIEPETWLVTLLCNKKKAPVNPFPEDVHTLMEKILQNAVDHQKFKLKENDYTIDDKKCGGNAQYFGKENWLHHSSLIAKYTPNSMHCLMQPEKQPKYRKQRSHDAFLCSLQDIVPSFEELIDNIKIALQQWFDVRETHMPKMPIRTLKTKKLL